MVFLGGCTKAAPPHEHEVENGICTVCSQEWTAIMYDEIVKNEGVTPREYVHAYVDVEGGTVELSFSQRTFLMDFRSEISHNEQIGFTLRTYVDDPGVTVFKGEGVEYSYHDPNAPESKTAPVSDLNIDFSFSRDFDPNQEFAKYTYLSTYTCPISDVNRSYETEDFLKGEDAFRFIWSKNADIYTELYTDRDFKDGVITMEQIFGGSVYMTKGKFFDKYIAEYKNCFKAIDEALAKYGTSLKDAGIIY